MVNYVIFADILYSKQIKLLTIVELSMEPATVSEAQLQNKYYCCLLKVLYQICAHFCHVNGLTSRDFHRIIRLQKWLSASWQYLQMSCILILNLQYTHNIVMIVMIVMCVICRLRYGINSFVYAKVCSHSLCIREKR